MISPAAFVETHNPWVHCAFGDVFFIENTALAIIRRDFSDMQEFFVKAASFFF